MEPELTSNKKNKKINKKIFKKGIFIYYKGY